MFCRANQVASRELFIILTSNKIHILTIFSSLSPSLSFSLPHSPSLSLITQQISKFADKQPTTFGVAISIINLQGDLQ